MNILLIGSGGREHALAWKISQSKKVEKLYIVPGNAGTGETGINVNIAPDDFEQIGKFALENKVGMVVVGPEDPLVKGIHDYFLASPALKDIAVIGPRKEGAMLEGSKDFAKQFMFRHGIPTARYKSISAGTVEEGITFLRELHPPYVLKADGLAAGKGVLILNSFAEAERELKAMLQGKFGNAGKTVVIEEYLNGIELSVFVITDGDTYKLLPEAKDYKRVGEGDTGLNTGGMGAVSPVPFAGSSFIKKVEERIIKPTIEGLKKDGIPYCGFIFFGLMNCNGEPYVIEYNVRMGDPESEVVIPRIKSDIVDLLEGVAEKNLGSKKIETTDDTVTTVMLVSGGYPGDYEKGIAIENIKNTSNCIVFHAGTKMSGNTLVTNGGRVLSVSAYGKNHREALEKCYQNAAIISFQKMYFRKDIGFDL
ncbi:MAG: phosphoribosylamine--glycine ligase [Bacteroidales bacterium]|nr:phosphoribosylamine--glycine ligase [Bacteroidales bacterium]